MEQHSSGIPTTLRALQRRVSVIVLCCVLVPVIAFAFSASQEKQYTASASLLFRDPGFDQKLFGSQVFESSPDPERAAATNLKLVSLDIVADRTANRLPAARPVRSHVEVQGEGESDVLGVSATYPNPRLAATVANAFAREYIAYRREADRTKIAEARALVQRRVQQLSPGDQSSQARSLRARLDQLDILASLQTGNAELAEAAKIPSAPSSPKVVRNTVLGVVLGLLLGVALALLFERLDRRLRDPKEIEEIFDRPILGTIPQSGALSRAGTAQEALPSQEREAFMMLRANLRYFNIDRGGESVLVTSAAPGDGKSTVAWNLASTAAGTGAKVLLVEADLRRPTLAISLGLRGASGLSTVLSTEVAFGDAVQQIQVRQAEVEEKGNGRGVRTVDVLLAGPLPPNPADLLESDRMRELISTAESSYDLVVIDTPPASVLSDAIPLVKQVGGIVVVSRLAKTTREAATHLRNQLRNLDAPVLGVVVNAIGSDAEAYGYGYGYAAGYEREKPDPDPPTPDADPDPPTPNADAEPDSDSDSDPDPDPDSHPDSGSGSGSEALKSGSSE